MIHHRRTFAITNVGTAEALAEKLSHHTWCGCNGFRLGPLLFLNDAFSADGAQEYAVWHEPRAVQIESVTASWMSEPALIGCIERLLARATDAEPITSCAMPSLAHGKEPCSHCL
jgi:hypothetical protein